MSKSNVPTYKSYLTDSKDRIWQNATPKHKSESVIRCARFGEFRQNDTRLITDFKRNDLHVYMDHLINVRNLTDSTANRHLVAVGALFQSAYEDEIITRPVKAKLYKEDRNRMRVFSDTEVDQIIRLARASDHPWIADMCVLSLNTGMRLGEIAKFIEGEADFEIDEDDFAWIHLPKTKNGDRRYVPLNDDARAAGEALRAIKEPFRWVSRQKAFYTVWGKIRDKIARGDKEFVFHVFRHTAATKMANDLNLNSIVIGMMLGHRDTSTTAKYIKLKTATMKQVAKEMKRD